MTEGAAAQGQQLYRAILEGKVPRQARLFAAQGLLPIPREELYSLQVVLAADPDEELAGVAKASLGEEPEESIVEWLRTSCALEGMKPAADKVVEVSESGGLTTERLVLGVDVDFNCPAVLVRPAEPGPEKRAAVVLSHDGRQSAASARIGFR